jgi:hypothetical protein
MTEVVMQHNWSTTVAGERFGWFQYQSGPGHLDAHSALLLRHVHLDLPVPLFALALLCLRRIERDPSGMSDYQENDATGRPIEIHVCGSHALKTPLRQAHA